MIKKINNTERITEALRKDGKVTVLNSSQNIKAIISLNNEMELVRRDFKNKNQMSQISAAKATLTS